MGIKPTALSNIYIGVLELPHSLRGMKVGTQVSISLVLYSGYRLRTKGLPVDCSMRLGLHRDYFAICV